MAASQLSSAPSVADHPAMSPALRLEVAAEHRQAAEHYAAAASEATSRGDDVRAAEYTARAERNQAAADEMSEADVRAHDAASYVRTPSVSSTRATVQLCAADYAAGANLRALHDRQRAARR